MKPPETSPCAFRYDGRPLPGPPERGEDRPHLDLYAEDVSSGEWHLLDFWPEPGEYTLRLLRVGKNVRSTGRFLGIESVRLHERRPRVKTWAHDRDWREDPVLYR